MSNWLAAANQRIEQGANGDAELGDDMNAEADHLVEHLAHVRVDAGEPVQDRLGLAAVEDEDIVDLSTAVIAVDPGIPCMTPPSASPTTAPAPQSAPPSPPPFTLTPGGTPPGGGSQQSVPSSSQGGSQGRWQDAVQADLSGF